MFKKLAGIGFLITSVVTIQNANSFTMYLDNGYFYGPGNAIYNDTGIQGRNEFVDAQVRNIFFTSPTQGGVAFFNNGALEPNAIAEKLQVGGVVDGLATDGTLINENADTALRLNFRNTDGSESADVMVIAEFSLESDDGSEPIAFDEFGNLSFSPSVVADPGVPELISRFNVKFTTGAAQVPLSLKSQQGGTGGADQAGPLPSGHFLIGRIGDYDQDGFMDGVLVLAENAPMDLIVARGNPIAQYRPWRSDIPVPPLQAAIVTLSGIVNNYPLPVVQTLNDSEFFVLLQYLEQMQTGLSAALINLRREILSNNGSRAEIYALKRVRKALVMMERKFKRRYQFIEKILIDSNRDAEIYKPLFQRKLQCTFEDIGKVLSYIPQDSESQRSIRTHNLMDNVTSKKRRCY